MRTLRISYHGMELSAKCELVVLDDGAETWMCDTYDIEGILDREACCLWLRASDTKSDDADFLEIIDGNIPPAVHHALALERESIERTAELLASEARETEDLYEVT